MPACVYIGDGDMAVRDVPVPTPRPGEAMIEVSHCGICGTDLHLVLEKYASVMALLTMALFSIFFGRLGGLEDKTAGVPYPVFVLCALVPWQLFSYALTQSSNSVVSEQRLLTKV